MFGAPLRKALIVLAVLVLGVSVVLTACSSDGDRMDQSYGTDAGIGYTGPEAGFDTASSTQSDKDTKSSDDTSSDTNSNGPTKDTAGTADATVDL
jgi:hypothetical protein